MLRFSARLVRGPPMLIRGIGVRNTGVSWPGWRGLATQQQSPDEETKPDPPKQSWLTSKLPKWILKESIVAGPDFNRYERRTKPLALSPCKRSSCLLQVEDCTSIHVYTLVHWFCLCLVHFQHPPHSGGGRDRLLLHRLVTGGRRAHLFNCDCVFGPIRGSGGQVA